MTNDCVSVSVATPLPRPSAEKHRRVTDVRAVLTESAVALEKLAKVSQDPQLQLLLKQRAMDRRHLASRFPTGPATSAARSVGDAPWRLARTLLEDDRAIADSVYSTHRAVPRPFAR